jgi:ribosome maturation factor RimP
MSPTVADRPVVTPRALRPLLGRTVVVRTAATLWRGTLLSCVRDSAWLVVDDADVVLPLDDLVSVRAL